MQAPPPQPQQPIQQPYNAYGAPPPQPGMQPAPMPASQIPMSTMNTVHQQAMYPEIDARGCKGSGGMQMVVGTLILIFGIVSICIDCEYSYYGTAIWGGIWFIIGGFLGASAIRASGSSASCQLTGYLVLNIFSIIYAFDLIVTMCVAIGKEGDKYSVNYAGVIQFSSRGARIAIDSVLLVLAVLEVFAACWGTGVASKTVCGTRHQTVVTTQPVQVTYTTTTTAPNYYANQPAAMSVTTQYAYLNQNVQPGPSMPHQPGAAAYPPPPAYEKRPLEQP